MRLITESLPSVLVLALVTSATDDISTFTSKKSRRGSIKALMTPKLLELANIFFPLLPKKPLTSHNKQPDDLLQTEELPTTNVPPTSAAATDLVSTSAYSVSSSKAKATSVSAARRLKSRLSKCSRPSHLLSGLLLLVVAKESKDLLQSLLSQGNFSNPLCQSPPPNSSDSFEALLLQAGMAVTFLLVAFFLCLALVTVALATARYFGWRGRRWRCDQGSSSLSSPSTKNKSEKSTGSWTRKAAKLAASSKAVVANKLISNNDNKVARASPRSRLFSSTPATISTPTTRDSPASVLANSSSPATTAAAQRLMGSKVNAAEGKKKKKS